MRGARSRGRPHAREQRFSGGGRRLFATRSRAAPRQAFDGFYSRDGTRRADPAHRVAVKLTLPILPADGSAPAQFPRRHCAPADNYPPPSIAPRSTNEHRATGCDCDKSGKRRTPAMPHSGPPAALGAPARARRTGPAPIPHPFPHTALSGSVCLFPTQQKKLALKPLQHRP